MAPVIPPTANAAMLMAAKRTLAETAPRTLHAAGYAIVVRRGVTFLNSDAQKITFGVFFAYLVAIAIISYIPMVNKILWPFKMLTVSFHEFGHAFACIMTCGKVDGLELDPREGGCTHMHGGMPWVTLPAGYLGSAFMGALLIFCGYNIVASKIASFVIGVVSIMSLYWGMKTWFKKKYSNPWVVPLIIAINDGLMVACWFIANSEALRFYVVSCTNIGPSPRGLITNDMSQLFIGTMACAYSIWDIYDDCIRRKVGESDASKLAEMSRGSVCCCLYSSRGIGVMWDIIATLLMIAGLVCGMIAFPESESEQQKDSDNFVDSSPSS